VSRCARPATIAATARPVEEQVRIGIDARFLTHPQMGGFKTYTESLLQALTQVDRENEYLFYVDRDIDARSAFPCAGNCSFRVVAGAAPLVGMMWREQVTPPRRASQDRIALLHSPALTAPLWLSCPFVLTIHDVIWLDGAGEASFRRRALAVHHGVVARNAARLPTHQP